MRESPDTFFRSAWSSIQDASRTELQADGGDTVEAVMRHVFAWDPSTGSPTPPATVPRDIVRLYFHLLNENERMPEDAQLSMDDVQLVRNTLLGTLAENQDLKALVDRLFQLVQSKIEEGRVTQAWLVLQIFDYDRSVRLWNERNLYLEEMTLRFAEQPEGARQAVAPDVTSAVTLVDSDVVAATRALEYVGRDTGVHLKLFGTDPAEEPAWQRLFDATSASTAVALPGQRHTLQSVLRRKWRAPSHSLSADPGEIVAATLSPEAIKAHVSSHLKAGYFLLLVSEPTGWESFLPKLFQWLVEPFDGEGVTIFSDLHGMVTMEKASVREALDSVYSSHAEAGFRRKAASLGGDDVARALRGVIESVSGADLGRVPPGNYSLTGMLLDRLLGLEYPDERIAWYIHRIL